MTEETPESKGEEEEKPIVTAGRTKIELRHNGKGDKAVFINNRRVCGPRGPKVKSGWQTIEEWYPYPGVVQQACRAVRRSKHKSCLERMHAAEKLVREYEKKEVRGVLAELRAEVEKLRLENAALAEKNAKLQSVAMDFSLDLKAWSERANALQAAAYRLCTTPPMEGSVACEGGAFYDLKTLTLGS